MEEHLVLSYFGTYYITTGDIEVIESNCDQDENYDMVVASWDEGDAIARANALSDYLTRPIIRTKDDLDRLFNLYEIDTQDIAVKFTYAVNGIINNCEECLDNIFHLFSSGDLTDEEYSSLCYQTNNRCIEQLNLVNDCIKDYIKSETDTNSIRQFIITSKKPYID